MPDLTRYAEAAAWCEEHERYHTASADEVRSIAVDEFAKPHEQEQAAQEHERGAAHAALALRAVRAFEAWKEGRVRVREAYPVGVWRAAAGDGVDYYAPDPLDAITMALEAPDAP